MRVYKYMNVENLPLTGKVGKMSWTAKNMYLGGVFIYFYFKYFFMDCIPVCSVMDSGGSIF